MEEIYPHRWSATLGAPGSSAFRTWRRALADLSVAQLARGVAACICRSDPWPPSLPEFRTLCLGDAPSLGLPDEEGAYLAACRADWTHAVVWHAAQAVGVHALRTQTEVATRSRFVAAYRVLVARAAAGERFTLPDRRAPALTHRAGVSDLVGQARYLAERERLRGGESPVTRLRKLVCKAPP